MTVKQLMNTANVTPDVTISIMGRLDACSPIEEIYFGRYDQTSESVQNMEVDRFRVTHLRQLEYRTDIDRMIIYT